MEHAVPFDASGLHTPPRQKSPFGQSALVLHPVHCVAPQMPGVQSCVRFPGHEPCPSQNSRNVAVFMLASHEAARHSVF